jgi:hypothetical protein
MHAMCLVVTGREQPITNRSDRIAAIATGEKALARRAKNSVDRTVVGRKCWRGDPWRQSPPVVLFFSAIALVRDESNLRPADRPARGQRGARVPPAASTWPIFRCRSRNARKTAYKTGASTTACRHGCLKFDDPASRYTAMLRFPPSTPFIPWVGRLPAASCSRKSAGRGDCPRG